MIDKSYRFRVIESNCTSLKVGDVVKPIKILNGNLLIGHSYYKALPFEGDINGVMTCDCLLNPGKILAKIERIN